ncbi:MAG: SPFH domain-containing protein, partial [Gammaproteobacteria bacterium]|nr:SPFH domain-containing protein [Gammaproteobacteria bacterium]
SSGVPFLDLAANQIQFAAALATQLVPEFAKIGIKLENITVQNVSLPEELQKVLDQRIGMGMVGNDMGKFMQYQTAQAIPKFAEGAGNGGGGIAGDAMGLGAGVALGQVLAQNLSQGLGQGQPAPAAASAQSQPSVAVVTPNEVMATLEKLGELKSKGILTQEEFDAKKADLLKKLV